MADDHPSPAAGKGKRCGWIAVVGEAGGYGGRRPTVGARRRERRGKVGLAIVDGRKRGRGLAGVILAYAEGRMAGPSLSSV